VAGRERRAACSERQREPEDHRQQLLPLHLASSIALSVVVSARQTEIQRTKMDSWEIVR
jgi:hypothetical protein